MPFKSTAPLWGILALAASPALAQTPATASFPSSLDESGLRAWLAAQTDMPASAVVSIGSNSVIGLRQVIGDPAGPGRFQIQIRAEVVNQRTAVQGGYLSWAADLAIDCVQRRTRALGITNYNQRNLKGESRVVGGPAADWVTPAAGTQLYSLLSAVCDHTFRRPLDQQVASAAPAPAAVAPAPAAAPAPAPARPAVVAAQTTPPPAPRPAPAPAAAPAPRPAPSAVTATAPPPAPRPTAPAPAPAPMTVAQAPAAPSTPAPTPAPVATRPAAPSSMSVAVAPSPPVTAALPAPVTTAPPRPPEQVDVGDDEEPAAATPSVVAQAPPPRAEPPKVQVAVAAPPAQATQPSPATAAPSFAPPPPQPPAPPPRRALSKAAVQVGAGGSEAEARGLAARAKRNAPGGADLSVTVARVNVNGRTVYRALVHGFASKGEATAACASIKSRGQDCFVRDSF